MRTRAIKRGRTEILVSHITVIEETTCFFVASEPRQCNLRSAGVGDPNESSDYELGELNNDELM